MSLIRASLPPLSFRDAFRSMHAAGFREFLLKPELLNAISDCGFEHPSQVQHECIPQAILGTGARAKTRRGWD